MQAIREIVRVRDRRLTLRVPASLDNHDVEVIVLSLEDRGASGPHRTPAALRGSLKAYANPALIHEEADVWSKAAGEKHEAG